MDKRTLSKILRSSSSVISFKELLMELGEQPEALNSRLHYYIQRGELYTIRRGLYAKDKNYDRLELATKIFTPAYVSFETVLRQAGVIFQHYETIFVASYQTKEIISDGQTYSFRKLKDTILMNPMGLENKGSYYSASPERAFLDLIYLRKDYYFDNLTPLDKDKIQTLLPIYENKAMIKRMYRYFDKE
jgi:hypothetical protein